MADKTFYPTTITLSGMGFASKELKKNDPKYLFAIFYYVHHCHFINEINEKLKKKGLRPMTDEELQYFFTFNRLSLSQLNHPYFITTSPEDIKPHDTNKNLFLIPCIGKDHDELKFGKTIINKVDDQGYIPDHYWTVLAIDEKKS